MKEKRKIYLDYQASTPTDERVLNEMQEFYLKEFGNPHSTNHIYGWNASKAIDLSKQTISDYLGIKEDEIIFTSGATESNNLAIIGTCLKNKEKKRNKILISSLEHPCVIESAEFAKKYLNYKVDVIPVNKDGYLDLDVLKNLASAEVLLASIMLVNNEIGVIQNIKKIQELLKPFNILLHSDAAQAPLAMEIINHVQHVDMFSLSGHKFYGPKGIGILAIKNEIKKLISPILHGGGQQDNLRSGTLPTPLCIGFAKGIEILKKEGNNERKKTSNLRNNLYHKLKEVIPSITLNGPDINERHPINLNLFIPGIVADDLIGSLQPKISISSGSACTTGEIIPSHVLKAIGLSDEKAEYSFRIATGRYTSEEDIEEFIKIITKKIKEM
tara:strand:- start:926 stop:2083 length:1158 start_codon:yes stop_codon:yes gene_type:complete